jgi:hypothetical protein
MKKKSFKSKHHWRRLLKLIPNFKLPENTNCWFDAEEADKAVEFLSCSLPLPLEDWQKAVIGAIYGWKMKNSHGEIVRCLPQMGLPMEEAIKRIIIVTELLRQNEDIIYDRTKALRTQRAGTGCD